MLDKFNITNVFNCEDIENYTEEQISCDKFFSLRNKDLFLTKLLKKKNGKEYTEQLLPQSYYNTFVHYADKFNISSEYTNKILNMFDTTHVRCLKKEQFWDFMSVLLYSTSGLYKLGFEKAIINMCNKYNIKEKIKFEDLIDFECIEK